MLNIEFIILLSNMMNGYNNSNLIYPLKLNMFVA